MRNKTLLVWYAWCIISGFIGGILAGGQPNYIVIGGLLVLIAFNTLLFYIIRKGMRTNQ